MNIQTNIIINYILINLISIGPFYSCFSLSTINTNDSFTINTTNERYLSYRNEFEAMRNRFPIPEVCVCDLKIDHCDVECCCDLNCTEVDLYAFRRCNLIANDDDPPSRFCRPPTNAANSFANLHASPIFCLIKDNTKLRQTFVDKNLMTSREQVENVEYPHKYLWSFNDDNNILLEESIKSPATTITKDVFSNIGSLVKYKSGYRINRFIFNNNKTNGDVMGKYYHWRLPFSIIQKNGQCNNFRYVQYLYDFHSVCLRNLIPLQRKCSHDVYFDWRTYQQADSVFLYQTFSNFSEVRLVQAKPNGNYDPPYFDQKTGLCHNVVEKVEYIVIHEGISGIREVNITVKMMNLSISDKRRFFSQTYNVSFVRFENGTERNLSLSWIPNTGNNALVGYVWGSKVPFSMLKENNTRTLFDQHDLILNLHKNGFCREKIIKNQTIDFGINRKTSCRLNIDLINIAKQNVCSVVTSEIGKFLKHGHLDKDLYIASLLKTGNHDHDHDHLRWIKLINSSSNVENNALTSRDTQCKNSILGMFYRIFFIKLNPTQNQIVGGEVRPRMVNLNLKCSHFSHASENTTMEKCNLTKTIDLITIVNFVDISEPFVPEYAPAPSIKIELPNDFFYPFSRTTTATSSSSSSTALMSSLGNLIFLYIMIISFNIHLVFMGHFSSGLSDI